MENEEFNTWLNAVENYRKIWKELEPGPRERCEHFAMNVHHPTGAMKLPMLSIGAELADDQMEEFTFAGLSLFDAEFEEDEIADIIRLKNADAVQRAIDHGIFPFIDDGLLYLAVDATFII